MKTKNLGGEKGNIVTKVLFIIGIIAILIFLAFAIITLVPRLFRGAANVGSSLGNNFNAGGITLSVNDSDLASGEDFVASWDYSPRESGMYSFTYECAEDVTIDIYTASGKRTLICNTPFTLGATAQSIKLSANLASQDSFADVPLKVYYTHNNDQAPTAQGETTITVKNGNSAPTGTLSGGETTVQSTITDPEDRNPNLYDGTGSTGSTGSTISSTQTSTTYTSVPTYTTPTTFSTGGRADLAISDVLPLAGQSAVQFTVRNLGSGTSGTWHFTYTTPTNPVQIFTSPAQISLAPGQGLRTTVRFAAQNTSPANITINIDPNNVIAENNESNNSTIATITGATNGGGTVIINPGNGSDPDLVIDDLEAGRIDGNRFEEDNRIDDRDDAAVRFTVRNEGGQSTGSWRFEITDTPNDGDTYRSGSMQSLAPGQEMTVIIEFENPDDGDYEMEVTVDYRDDVDEDDERNNDDEVELEVRD